MATNYNDGSVNFYHFDTKNPFVTKETHDQHTVSVIVEAVVFIAQL